MIITKSKLLLKFGNPQTTIKARATNDMATIAQQYSCTLSKQCNN